MRNLLLLLPCVLLTGAAPPSIGALAECRLSQAEVRALVATLPVDRRNDESQAPDRAISTYFGGPMPKLFGFQATQFGSTDMLDSRGERYMVITNVEAPFADVRAAVLKAHGEEACPMEGSDPICVGTLRSDGDWKIRVIIADNDSDVSFGCAYMREK
jgi:hypothetical protein